MNKVARDAEGYLISVSDWTPKLAEQLAREDHLTLNTQHWQVINFARDFYQQYHHNPAIRALVQALKAQYGADVGNSLYLQQLFPSGAAKQISKIAGLPKPKKCI